jgi:signal transduction histidine kinase
MTQFIYTFFILILIFAFHCKAQPNNADSLLLLLEKNTKEDSIRVKIYAELANCFIYDNPQKVEEYANQTLMLSQKIGYNQGKFLGLYYNGIAKARRGEYEKAIELYYEAKNILSPEQIGDKIKVLNALGISHKNKGDYSSAILSYFDALDELQKINDIKRKSVIYTNIGDLYSEQGLYQQALEYFKNSYELKQKIKDERGMGIVNHNIGYTYLKMGVPNEAYYHLLHAFKVFEKGGDIEGLSHIINTLGEYFEKVNQLDSAFHYYSRSYQLRKNNILLREQIYSMRCLSSIYVKKKNFDKAQPLLLEALELSKKIGAKKEQQEVMKSLANLNFEMGNSKEAYKYLIQSNSLKDSIYNEKNAQLLTNATKKYELNKKDSEIQEKNRQINEQNSFIFNQKLKGIAIIVVLIFFLFTTVLLLKLNDDKKVINKELVKKSKEVELQKQELLRKSEQIEQQNEELTIQNQRLEQVNLEKDNLTSTVAHDLKSPLSKIEGFLNLISLDGTLNERQKDYIKIAQQVISSAYRLIRDLTDIAYFGHPSRLPQLENVNVRKLISDIILTFEEKAKEKNIKIHLVVEKSLNQVVTDVDFIFRIFDNLLSNSIKFSWNNSNIFVNVRNQGEYWSISIRDEGQGFSEEDKKKLFVRFQKLTAKPTAGENSTGLGLSIVKALIDKLHGHISLESSLGKGAEFILIFPKNP